jgi:diguanylate cyclase (GGDEF)-like protein/PAS domain S-box-containing protein
MPVQPPPLSPLDRVGRRSRRLLVAAVVVMSVPMLVGIYALDRAQERQREAAGESRLAIARAMAGQVEVALEGARNGIRAMASQPGMSGSIVASDSASVGALLRNARESTPFYRSFAVFDADQDLVAAEPASDLPLFATLADGVEPHIEARHAGSEAVVLVRYPVRDAEGRAVGAVAAAISLDRILAAIGRTRFAETGAASVVDREANFIASASPERRGQKLTAPSVVALAASGGEGVRRFWSDLLRRREFGAIAPVPSYGMSVLVTQSEAEVFQVISLFQRGLLAGLVMLALGASGLLLLALRTMRAYERSIVASRALLESVIESTTDIVYVKDLEGRYLLMNAAGARYIGRDPSGIVGLTDADLFDAETAARIRQLDRDVIECAAPMAVNNRSHDAWGVPHLFSIVRAPYRDESGKVVGVIGVARDITQEHDAEQAIAASEKRHRELFEMSKGLICMHELDGTLITVNPASADMLGYAPQELAGRRLQELVPAEYQSQFEQYLGAIAESGEVQGVLALVARNGERRFLQFSNRLYAEAGRAPYVIGHATDITERRRYEERLREQSFSDPLTGLFNRRWLAHREERAADDARFGTIVIDLDHFKQVNDTYGHQRGDEVLVEMGRFLARHARHGDAVVRMGGDEFLVLLDDGDEAATAALAARITADAANAPCGFSIGHAVREHGEPLEKTIDRADQTLYRIRVEVRGYERRKH